jgi:hypothetical protein
LEAKVSVPVFISYHGSDIELAKELSTSLKKLSNQFKIFLDKYSIAPGEKYETIIADEISKAEWFLIVCTGFPRRDADMMWSFFEAGQFRATLRETLRPEVNKRIVCVFDDEPPAVLSMFQGIKVCALQRSGAKIDLSTPLPKSNIQLDDSAIYNLLERMLLNTPEIPLRDVGEDSTKELLREESFKLIKLFASARPHDVLIEKSLQPRISFELLPGQALEKETKVKGYDQSLRLLFGIETDEATWGKVISICKKGNTGNPRWLSDIEAASALIMADETPDNVGNKCILQDVIYRVIVARYEVYKDARRAIYVAFLPASTQPFDLTRSSSTLLSSLILSVRFREQIIPLAEAIRQAEPEKLRFLLQDFYRLLVGVEMEARQFGLVLDNNIPAEEAPLTTVMSDPGRKAVVQTSIDDWSVDRRKIEEMFVGKPVDLASIEQAQSCADEIANALEKIKGVNAQFIEIITVELLAQMKERDRRRLSKMAGGKPTPKLAKPHSKSKNDRKRGRRSSTKA